MTDPVRELGRDVADALGERPPEDRTPQQRAQFIAHAARGYERAPRRSWMLVPATVGATALLVLMVSWWRGSSPEPAPTTPRCIANGEDVIEGQWLHPAAENPVDVQFSEGSRVTVEPQARVRLAKLQPSSVHLSIEAGSVDSDITHGSGISWTFLAGPYQVAVLGTRLSIEWNPEGQLLAVEVAEGRVRVIGAQLGADGIAVAGGQRLEASSDSVSLSPTPSSEVVAGASPDELEPEQTEEPEARSETSSRPRTSSWRQLAEEGRYAEAVEAAEGEGFGQLVQELPPYELLELADAARLSGNVRRARQSLLWLRVRFAGQRPAHVAAFRLGRLANDHAGNYSEAARWFETVISEAPQGPQSADARGRLMDALTRQGRHGKARQVAREYLDRHPGGAYEATARSLVSEEAPE